ncbi:hypothetical protein BPUTEOMOX_2178 [methanotrophic endosymbiont of Bathymodiolus puteoserpentis (Logatchev)]|jgi:hypothetical protein|nr:hypothetical protein [uncultured Gammaproteobacteria bacterium]SHE23168.1 hypothetical protein BPUTEOMOX_2178 [methanotrophic endosymbiont of Bathymodiolus puteoserpentis (Logatchev)]
MADFSHQYKRLAECYDEYEQGQGWTLYWVDNILVLLLLNAR